MERVLIKTNKSKHFFTPIFNLYFPLAYFDKLVNTYLWYDDFYDESFCLLYEFDGRIRGKQHNRRGFTTYEANQIFTHDLFEGYDDYGIYVLYKFKLNDELLEFRDKLLEGRYSLLEENYKRVIIEFNRRVYGDADALHIRRILYRDQIMIDELADDLNVNPDDIPEAMSSINPDKELFTNSLILREDEKISETSNEDMRPN